MVLLSPGVGTVEVTTDLDFEERVIVAFPSVIFCAPQESRNRVIPLIPLVYGQISWNLTPNLPTRQQLSTHLSSGVTRRYPLTYWPSCG